MRVILRGSVMFGLFWGLVILLNRWLDLSPDWPQWSVPLIGALGAELILWSYRYEREAVGEKRGRWLVALRSRTNRNIVCDRDECSFIFVRPTARRRSPIMISS